MKKLWQNPEYNWKKFKVRFTVVISIIVGIIHGTYRCYVIDGLDAGEGIGVFLLGLVSGVIITWQIYIVIHWIYNGLKQ